VYVADFNNNRIQAFTGSGDFIVEWGMGGGGNGQFRGPYGVAIGAGGVVYVADSGNNRIQVFGPNSTSASSRTLGSLKAKYR
jgi:DNA-binding beta-propeller fold protein YncE